MIYDIVIERGMSQYVSRDSLYHVFYVNEEALTEPPC